MKNNKLFDLAVKAREDRHIGDLTLKDNGLTFKYGGKTHSFSFLSWESVNDGIKLLDKATNQWFPIYQETDIELIDINLEPWVTLSNGNKAKITSVDHDGEFISIEECSYVMDFFTLKGATIKQKRLPNDEFK